MNTASKSIILTAAVILLLSSPALVCAEYYQYIDENGHPCFTDDKTRIPETLMDRIKTIQSIDSTRRDQAHTEKTDPITRAAPNTRTWDGNRMAAARQLQEEKEMLDRLFEKYRAEQRQLETEQQACSAPNDAALQKKIEELNQRIRQYHEKCRDLESKIIEFNASLGL